MLDQELSSPIIEKTRRRLYVLSAVFLGLLATFGVMQSLGEAPAQALMIDMHDSHTMLPLQNSPESNTGTAEDPARTALLGKTIHLHFVTDDDRMLPDWNITVKSHPHWIKMQPALYGTIPVFDEARMVSDIQASIEKLIVRPRNCQISTVSPDDMNVERAKASCVAKSGQTYDAKALTQDIHAALSDTEKTVTVSFTTLPGLLTNTSSASLGSLTLLATGKSNFEGSGESRKSNVRLAINSHVNGVVVQPGAIFSFNKTLGPSMSSRFGWKMALGIFGGSLLEPTLGGGVCQASTTEYRGVLYAGLPILQARSHSLFVHYYESYGLGQDVTIYFGSQDFKFQNDTSAPLVIQAYTEGDMAYVNIYGTSDGRTVTLDGPYFTQNAPADVQVDGHALRSNQIGWVRHIRYADGTKKDELFVSQYKSIPKATVKKAIAEAEAKKQIAKTNMEVFVAQN